MKVSIVIPTYKRPVLLGRLMASIVLQTYQDFEVIIVDDNSSNMAEYKIVIDKYKSHIKELTFFSNDTNRGAPYSRNRGIKAAKYELVALVDDDDEWLPTKLEKQVSIFKSNDDKLGIVYTWTDAINERGAIVHRYRGEVEGKAISLILNECFIPSPSVMVRRDAIMRAGLFDESFPSCQDWDMWTRLLAKGYECRVVKQVVSIYHKHTQTSIGSSRNASLGFKKYYEKHLFLALAVDRRLFIKFLKHIIKNRITALFQKWR